MWYKMLYFQNSNNSEYIIKNIRYLKASHWLVSNKQFLIKFKKSTAWSKEKQKSLKTLKIVWSKIEPRQLSKQNWLLEFTIKGNKLNI